MAQPFAEHLEGIQARWRNLPSCVLLWRWPETVFGVFFSNESEEKFLASLDMPTGRSETVVVSSSTKKHTIPVYFDFEAAWARLTRQRGTLAYPHSLPSGTTEGEDVPGAQSAQLDRIAGLLARPIRPGAENAPLHVSPFFFPRSYQRLLETGLVERRTILDPQKVPPFQARLIERVAFVQGELSAPDTEQALFQMLMAIHVTPFLFASDGSRVLLATLSPAPIDIDPGPGRPPAILGNMRRFLNGIQIVREPVPALSVLVNHRYDRLFPSVA
jgi:hypothetical protein